MAQLTFRTLLLSCCCARAAKIRTLGWNIRYDFNDSDLRTSIEVLTDMKVDDTNIPWDIHYVTVIFATVAG